MTSLFFKGHEGDSRCPLPLVNIKIGGKWMFIHPKIALAIGYATHGHPPFPPKEARACQPQARESAPRSSSLSGLNRSQREKLANFQQVTGAPQRLAMAPRRIRRRVGGSVALGEQRCPIGWMDEIHFAPRNETMVETIVICVYREIITQGFLRYSISVSLGKK